LFNKIGLEFIGQIYQLINYHQDQIGLVDIINTVEDIIEKNMSGVCPCLTANMGTGGHNVPLHSMDKLDKLTPEECELLQSIPEGYTNGVSNSQRYKMIGNGWTIDVLTHIFKGIDND